MKTLLLAVLAVQAGAADLASVRAEPNLEKRSEKALQNAEAALTRARAAYEKGETAAFTDALSEVGQSIDLCRQSLEESGKNPRKQPKYFKRAEIAIRKLARRLENFRQDMSVDDRPPVAALMDKAQKLQEDLLHMIMGQKK